MTRNQWLVFLLVGLFTQAGFAAGGLKHQDIPGEFHKIRIQLNELRSSTTDDYLKGVIGVCRQNIPVISDSTEGYLRGVVGVRKTGEHALSGENSDAKALSMITNLRNLRIKIQDVDYPAGDAARRTKAQDAKAIGDCLTLIQALTQETQGADSCNADFVAQ